MGLAAGAHVRMSDDGVEVFLRSPSPPQASGRLANFHPNSKIMAPSFPDNIALLRYLYEDVTRISEVSSPDIILHPADRDVSNPPRQPLVGLSAVQAHEDALLAATHGTLVMDVESITANEHFGAVMGKLRAKKEGRSEVAVPFCGLWRFKDGRAVEHWENAVDAAKLGEWLMDA